MISNIQQRKNEALAIIDAALSILNKFPDISEGNSELSFSTSTNPFPFLMDAFKSTAGYNVLIRILSKFLLVGLPPLEVAVKGVLLSNIKNILTCSINPFISDEVLRDGIVFNLEQIDITDTLRYCPTDIKGQYYYFDNKVESVDADGNVSKPDIDDQGGVFKLPDELKYSEDFNCLLWYMKNRASFREVWGKKASEDNAPLESNDDYWDESKKKCKKAAGIVTLEFNERTQSLKDAQGDGFYAQTPFNNCLHVFLGNVKEKDVTKEGDSVSQLEADALAKSIEIANFQDKIYGLLDELAGYKESDKKNEKLLKQGKITQDDYNARCFGTSQLNSCEELIYRLQDNMISYEDFEKEMTKEVSVPDADGETEPFYNGTLQDLLSEALDTQKACDEAVKEKVEIIKRERNLTLSYREISQNYYYKRTLIEFNTDYVMSLRLFDSKVIAAQLIDSLTGLLTIDMELTYKQQLIKSEVKKMVEMIVNTDDTVVDDCFFTFTNDAYDSMLEKAELNRMKLFSVDGEANGTAPVDAEELLSNLNSLNPNAIQTGDTTVIEHALTEISKTLSKTTYEEKDSLNFGIQMNFIENLMNNLAYVITSAVLSPKVYLLILVNLQILGRDTNFSLEEFMGKYKKLIASILRTVRDQLLEYLVKELMDILGDIAAEVAVKIGIEQIMYYNRLMKRILDAFRRLKRRTTVDFNIDNVDYADIEPEEEIEKKVEC